MGKAMAKHLDESPDDDLTRLRRLFLFDAVCEAGGIGQAATRAGRTQPAVHRAARQIEQTVGVSLYRRRVHSVSANAAGLEFARCLSLALYEIAQAREEIAYARGQLSGKVAIGVLPLMPPRLVARVIQR